MIDTWRDHGVDKGINGADKQALINLVNATDVNQSVVKTNVATALNAVSTDKSLGFSSTSTWAEIVAKIPEVKTGKKWATGSVVSAGTLTGSVGYLASVSGLSFQPKFVILYYTVYSSGVYYVYRMMHVDSTLIADANYRAANTRLNQDEVYNISSGTANPGTTKRDFVVTANGFTAYVSSPSVSCTWHAFE
ncbi:hypothetical protein AV540_26230 [Brevibacillus parabrevis]|uniref:hypothetical protein n=1 Tax=Brevibacillus parabrevis TaxID=54914 RepID=UPI0007AC043F|nr:hypothetical protein [Brevibacillus parabrevis]KZE55709.1 hypothetical protein AV540_26230 [Brevibacillus parabrevis]